MLRIGKSEGNPQLLCRSVKHLCSLEAFVNDNTTSDKQNKTTEKVLPDQGTATEQRRTAVVAGELRRRLCNVMN